MRFLQTSKVLMRAGLRSGTHMQCLPRAQTFRACASQAMKMSTEAPEDPKRFARTKRLMYHAQQRGWLELDVLIGKWAEENVPSLTDAELDEFEHILTLENPDLICFGVGRFKWLTGQAEAPEDLASIGVYKKMIKWVMEKDEPISNIHRESISLKKD